MPDSRKTLFVRLDRIGDLILTLPADQDNAHLPAGDSFWIIHKGLEFVMDASVPKRNYMVLTKEFAWSHIKTIIRYIRDNRIDRVVVFHAPWWVGFALWLAGVSTRIGRYSQWHSFLFFNKGLRQKRSLSEKHESEYNNDLVQLLTPDKKSIEPLKLSQSERSSVIKSFGLTREEYYVVHPGMNGSALNWPTEFYKKLVEQLSQKSKVAVTGTPSDAAYVDPLMESLGENKDVLLLSGKLSGSELIAILESAKGVVAPSTGVAHLAASTRTPIVGLYSNVIAEAANRWGPIGPFVEILEPTSEKTTEKKPEVMQEISVESVLTALDSQIKNKQASEA